ncbi:MAG: hypothetical protein EBZ59_00300 [Planctomycetia bacterium]|nr:hypothetical protein [Planctomycetia bacterium]
MSPVREPSRINPEVTVQFDHPDRIYEPSGAIGIRYRIEVGDDERIRAIEHSMLWYTEGKGEEDMGVHFFERFPERGRLRGGGTTGSFATHLPASPFSYEGLIVKIRWCVRVRIFLEGGRDFVSEHVFSLGRIPPASPPREALP